jgi:hypothetical protein
MKNIILFNNVISHLNILLFYKNSKKSSIFKKYIINNIKIKKKKNTSPNMNKKFEIILKFKKN